ncbi:hypothetical protein PIB30_008473 [Stylosanthes scabra]|uniref:Uncharacterized protein n=1 Tax=Stylosanthes scabra TaxID=79078 RepID=A0ABU6X3P2_9FABA|nr:hypothetical protein [Stylosanthes scabra]
MEFLPCSEWLERKKINDDDFGGVPIMIKNVIFFIWADQIQEAGGEEEITKLRRKVLSLKMKVKAAESKMKVVVLVGLIGWVWLLCAWVHYSTKMSPSLMRSGVVSRGLGGL